MKRNIEYVTADTKSENQDESSIPEYQISRKRILRNSYNEMYNGSTYYPDNLTHLNNDILILIINQCGFIGIHMFRFVCKILHSFVHNYGSLLARVNNRPFLNYSAASYQYTPNCYEKYVSFYYEAAENGYIEITEWLLYWTTINSHDRITVCVIAGKKGNLNFIKWAIKKNFISKEGIKDYRIFHAMMVASRPRHGFAMMWASPTRHPGSARMMVALRPCHGGKAAMIKSGDYKLLEWAMENGYAWDEYGSYIVAKCGNLELLK
jgi:hypothetical protein